MVDEKLKRNVKRLKKSNYPKFVWTNWFGVV